MKKTVIFYILTCFLLNFVYAKENLVSKKGDNKTKKIANVQERLDELEDRLDSVETSTMVDRLKLGADLRFTMNNFIYKDTSKKSLKKYGLISSTGENFNTWNMRARIKMVSWLSKSIKLTSWLTMYKNFLDSYPDMFQNYDMPKEYLPNDSRIYMERLFVDWFITKWLAFSIGRGPTFDGVPSDLRYDSVSLSSFPENAVDSPLDGFYFTFILHKIFPILRKSYLRLAYVPKRYSAHNKLFELNDDSGMLHLLDLEFETLIPGTSATSLYLTALFVPQITPYDPEVDIDNDGKSDKLFLSKTLGNSYNISIDIISKKPFKLPIDLFLAGTLGVANPKTRSKDDPNNGFIGTPMDKNGKTSPILTLLGDDFSGKTKYAYMFYAGIRYTLPWIIFYNQMKIGFNYNHASKYFFLSYTPDTTYLNNFAVRGDNFEAYFIFPINMTANIRLGYIYQHHDYPWQSILPPSKEGVPKIDETIQNFNFMFNFYF